MAAIPFLRTRFLGGSLVFMIVYIWGREFANARVNIHGLVELKVYINMIFLISNLPNFS